MGVKLEWMLLLLIVVALVPLFLSYNRHRHTPPVVVSCPSLDCSSCSVGCPQPVLRHCEPCPPKAVCAVCPSPHCGSDTAPSTGPVNCSKCGDRPCVSHLVSKLELEKNLRVVVAISTVPCKLWSERLYLVVQGIKQQTFQPDAIYLSIAEFGRRDGLPYILPPWLKQDKDVTVLKTKLDMGPVQKLLPVVAYEKDPETRIVTVDDDWVYPNSMLQQMIEWQLEHPDAAMSFTNGYNVTCWLHTIYKCNNTRHGRTGMPVMTQQAHATSCTEMRWKYGWDMCAAEANPIARPVHVIQGVGGCIYVRKFFGPDYFRPMINMTEWYRHPCFMTDDIYTSGSLAQRGVSRMVMPQRVLPPSALYVDGRSPRKIKPFTNPPMSIKHKESDMPHNVSLCGGVLHGDGRFGDYNRACARHFNKFFLEERVDPPYYEKPGYFMPIQQ